MTPHQFFTKNMKWFLLMFVVLFLFKSVQSCNRNMKLSISDKQYIHVIDSLKTKYNNLEKESSATINQLKFELKLQSEKAGAAEKNAADIKSIVEKRNTNIYNIIPKMDRDTIKRK